MESVIVVAMADTTTMIDNNHLDGTNKYLNMTDNIHGGGDEAVGDKLPHLAAIGATSSSRNLEREEEIEKLHRMHNEAFQRMGMGPLNTSIDEMIEADNRSVFVGKVDYGATKEELKHHFHGCGYIKRVTILCNKFGQPKGFAYIEFGNKHSVQTAVAMDDSLFKGRQIKVTQKRTNKPGLATTNQPPRAMLGSFRSGFSPYNSGYRPVRISKSYSRDMNNPPYIRREPTALIIRT